ncbi:SIMPL domain-containing protein [Motilibacter aurantiacus]|uniref:SIMPL domain-containing protein n=1 Tax=Motilibacter aurantiacus TaxID=2714955 RepID=UPI00140AC5D7|nr:SIMPL domain-containing protein [Motilibacter aurantiacus]NHC46793.1 SIMPL domain-containing protein [Motilibacter aurantiacus]
MPLLSVRGSARLAVPPDAARLLLGMSGKGPDNGAALTTVRASSERAVELLRAGGGVPLEPEARPALGFTRGQLTLRRPMRWDEQQGQEIAYGPVTAELLLEVVVRDWALLPVVTGLLAEVEGASLDGLTWQVDEDNSGWARARALAVAAARTRAEHYAAAVGAALDELEHLADAGLLGDPQHSRGAYDTEQAFAMSGRGVPDAGGLPHLEPVPQVLRAEVEARYRASP